MVPLVYLTLHNLASLDTAMGLPCISYFQSAQAAQPSPRAPQLVITKCSQWLIGTSQQGLLSSMLSWNSQPWFQQGMSGCIAPFLWFYFIHSGPTYLHVPQFQGKRMGQKVRSGEAFHTRYKISIWKTKTKKIWWQREGLESPQPCNV